MSDEHEFIDYYDVLQVSQNCDIKIIEGAYRHFAKIYHPDHEETADLDRFNLVIEAYNTLKFPEKRASYDVTYNLCKRSGITAAETELGDETAQADAAMQTSILLYLYKRKRENFREPGVASYFMQEHFGCSDDTFEFHIWYLKEKGYVEVTEQGTLAISVVGVDHVIALHQPRPADKFLTDRSHETGR
jgi:curved DNA-binding protein